MSAEKTGEVPKKAAKFKPIIFTNEPAPENVEQPLSEGRQNLKKWLGRMVRVTLNNKLTLVGIFSCTDRDQNLVIANCDTFSPDDDEPISYGTVMVPGDQIVSFEVDMPEESEEAKNQSEQQQSQPEEGGNAE
ncbi:hypothetical protein KR222_000435 [Zaprionus bogoriensis]|nr:hypothetical protein KR222_000435 [Zaprionus bogoriensis]